MFYSLLFFIFFFFWLCWLFVAVHRLSLVAAIICYSLVEMCRLLIAVVSFVAEQTLGPVGLVAQQHMESSQARDQTRVPCTSRRIFNLWTIREIQH